MNRRITYRRKQLRAGISFLYFISAEIRLTQKTGFAVIHIEWERVHAHPN
jgi:hypothetical protein